MTGIHQPVHETAVLARRVAGRLQRVAQLRMLLDVVDDPDDRAAQIFAEVGHLRAVARRARFRLEKKFPKSPFAAMEVRDGAFGRRAERFVPRIERPVLAHFVVCFSDRLESIFVKAKPDVQAVLLAAHSEILVEVAPARALAAEPPAHLVNRDVVLVLELRFGEPDCRRQ
jgi:hypothetical protein